MMFRRASTVRTVALFSIAMPSDCSSKSTLFIMTRTEVALCARTRTRSWLFEGSPFRKMTSRPILVRLGLMFLAEKALPMMASMSVFSIVWFIMTTGRAATGLEGRTRLHHMTFRSQVSFCMRKTRRRKAIWHTTRVVASFHPRTRVCPSSITLDVPDDSSSMYELTVSVMRPMRMDTMVTPVAIMQKKSRRVAGSWKESSYPPVISTWKVMKTALVKSCVSHSGSLKRDQR
mmetsp:Transcript_44219/g.99926  ORF Transcript_44219/g.99926 Transcript_44219/m.99926 type:complete len:232 (+) Transcript_44219:340-1035(+)